MKYIISTVGTSILTNFTKKEIEDCYGAEYSELSIEGYIEDLKDEDSNGYDKNSRCVNKIKNIICSKWLKGLKKVSANQWVKSGEEYNADACAELKGIYKIQDNKDDYEVYFLTTDTALSNLSADILKEYVPKIFKNVKVKDVIPIKDLQVYDYERFNKNGLNNLLYAIDNIKKIADKEQHDLILNVSGGYKAIIPYLTIYGQLYNIPVEYIYEDSDELITISKLPIQFDWHFAEKYFVYIYNPNILTDHKECLETLESYHLLHHEINNGKKKYKLNALGNMIKKYISYNMPASKNVMGYFMEYKFYEYFINNPYKNYTTIKHSVRGGWLENRELDLMMIDKNNNFVAVEIKSSYPFAIRDENYNNAFCKVKKEITAQIELMKNANKIPDEYHLYIYSSFLDFNKSIIDSINEIKILFNGMDCKFRAYNIYINYTYSTTIDGKTYKNSNPYQNFMSMPIGEKNINEISL